MCGRYTLTVDQEALSAALGVEVLLADHPRPRFNIAPTQAVPVWTSGGMHTLRWGLVPSWAEDASGAGRLINARSETVASKPSFRDAFRTGRCLVPADGFYEWVAPGPVAPGPAAPGAEVGPGRVRGSSAGRKTPWWIHLPDRDVFTFAGVWTTWRPPAGGDPLRTFTILTCEATGGIRDLHHRMPVVVLPDLRRLWLHGEGSPGAPAGAGGRLDPSVLNRVVEANREAAGGFVAYPVSTRVNGPGQDDPSLVEPASRASGGSSPPQTSLFD